MKNFCACNPCENLVEGQDVTFLTREQYIVQGEVDKISCDCQILTLRKAFFLPPFPVSSPFVSQFKVQGAPPNFLKTPLAVSPEQNGDFGFLGPFTICICCEEILFTTLGEVFYPAP